MDPAARASTSRRGRPGRDPRQRGGRALERVCRGQRGCVGRRRTHREPDRPGGRDATHPWTSPHPRTPRRSRARSTSPPPRPTQTGSARSSSTSTARCSRSTRPRRTPPRGTPRTSPTGTSPRGEGLRPGRQRPDGRRHRRHGCERDLRHDLSDIRQSRRRGRLREGQRRRVVGVGGRLRDDARRGGRAWIGWPGEQDSAVLRHVLGARRGNGDRRLRDGDVRLRLRQPVDVPGRQHPRRRRAQRLLRRVRHGADGLGGRARRQLQSTRS